MLKVRRSKERGYAHHGWLESYHSFSFSEYYDPKFMGFGPLRVINEDWVDPQNGFGTHGHRDMEIITYMLDGELSHRDSLGGGSTIKPNQIQRMSAGTGIRHSEINAHKTDVAHLLQIWIEPAVMGVAPGYKDHDLDVASVTGQLGLIVTGNADEAEQHNIAHIHQDAQVYAGRLKEQVVVKALNPARKAYLHVARGELAVGELTLGTGDALMIEGEEELKLTVATQAEVLLFDLPA
ncbi:pirin family protein [Limnobacter humi]|uniref:Pirin family protein n=1 Tax=Limnobacter humi TaxID=1778671 RepID=A0ABT1WCB3_9BURK|nr:pirin family protein [Limnobacter humi]MCQ8895152.1 pirin family protein [Limnobacter humi]